MKLMKPTTENLTNTFKDIFYMEGVDEVNYLEAIEKDGTPKNRVLIKVSGSMPRVIGQKGVCIRLIKHILENEFEIEDPNISVLEAQKK